ncbi:4-amino-4-deoxy-L-arabinose-phospho-UDP flippase [Achromobacter xylosoxidans]|nr:4-amino-4-deoxy-L-arabinose-phospho-UDP flippase [Achromobacter xylosoxidans]ODA18313.1 4-amino-4-deoxy-L-arabinose-phospho-UDP flippase [Achromobacter xylosoxidans]
MLSYLVAFLCVVGIAVGQILFKLAATSLARTGSLLAFQTMLVLGSAFALYGLTTIAWVWVLQKIELGRAYPLMALAFVMVPIGSHFFLGERFNSQYFLGVVVIMIGIVVAVRA